MKIICAHDYQDMSRKAANIISAQVIMKPNCVLGLATGGTPLGMYAQLINWYNKGDIDFSEVTTINLDEYRGLPREHEQSYWYFMHKNFFEHINIRLDHVYVPDGANTDAEKACKEYDEIIHRFGGVDMQLLGIGVDGHIGFNEPGAAFELGTHCVDLAESTIEANKRFFASADEVPRQAYTMGIKTIMQARKVLLIANGKAKAKAMRTAFFGPVTPAVPASILQMHPDLTVVADEEAWSECPEVIGQ
ncbi:MAG: glucosamine-6-phosphate deaminase [Clostridia bacterium]|nr:glucosamine-6-phosphate deaminase [Clostridia bacterium]